MVKAKSAKKSTGNTQKSVKLPPALETRVAEAMKLEGLSSFADFVRSALTRRCREIEREHAKETS